jgi:CBS domain containing-hemolysin-like protein
VGFKVGSKGVTKRELLAKSIIYRAWTMCWEFALATALVLLNQTNLYLYVVVVNAIKVAVYFAYDLGWFSYVGKPGILKRLRRWLGVGG